MARDLTLYPKKASKDELKNYLEDLGFVKCRHLWEWPKGTLNYAWFDNDDFKSIDGVSADIYPVFSHELSVSGNKYALHVRTRICASWYDVKMLNDVLRGARKLFGGTIHGDYGTNRYAKLWDDDTTPISRGVSSIYSHLKQNISSVRSALPEPTMKMPKTEKIDDLTKLAQNMDPSRVLYNGLVPFAVSMFEYFFSQAFQVLIKYDEIALEKRKDHKQKLDFETLLQLERKEVTIENVISSNYTFQNLDQLNKAYKYWLNIDVRKILFKKTKIGDSIAFLENRIAEIIQYRHGIIHHFSIDQSLTKEGYICILEVIEIGISEFVSFLEDKYCFKVVQY